MKTDSNFNGKFSTFQVYYQGWGYMDKPVIFAKLVVLLISVFVLSGEHVEYFKVYHYNNYDKFQWSKVLVH